MGGLIGRLRSFVRTTRNGIPVSDVKIDPGGGPYFTAEHFAPVGDDSHPLPSDFTYSDPAPQNGRYAVLGYVDPINALVAEPGEKRIYGRDAGSGEVVVQLRLRNDGSAEVFNDEGSTVLSPAGDLTHTVGTVVLTANADGTISGTNGSGSFALQPSGDFVVNGVTIAANGDIDVPSSLVVNSVEVADHDHAQGDDSGGNSEQDTGPMK